MSNGREEIEIHEDLISDLRINEDGLNFDSILEEENSDLKNLWKEMEQISSRDLLLSASMVCDKTIILICLERFFLILLYQWMCILEFGIQCW